MQQQIPGTELSIHTWLTVFLGRPIPIQQSTDGHAIGDFHTQGLDLCADLAKTVLETVEASLLCDYSTAARISKMLDIANGKVQFGVIIYSSTAAPKDFESVAMEVLKRINPSERHLVPKESGPCQEHADEFLARHGNKRIPEALVVKTQNEQIELRGKIPQKAVRDEIKPETIEVSGRVDEPSRIKRTLTIEMGKKKSMSVKFDAEKHLARLADALKDGKVYRFNLQTENNGNDKAETVLKDFFLLNDGWAF